jgi:CheY-like chemotaxis protein
VLVVEDNIVNSKVLTKQLKKQGFEVHVAYHGGEALDFLRTTRHWRGNADGPEVSIILMDAEMPVMDGLTCTKNIRRLESEGQITSHLPIIAVSANARAEQMAEMRASGMDDGISKPFRYVDILSTLCHDY